jgi:hypothetical protein
MVAYKLMRVRKNGTLGSLFINRKAIIPLNQWLQAYNIPTKGFAQRFGWHCTFTPYAPHLSTKGRVWVKCEAEDYTVYNRPESQGGRWVLASKIKIIKVLSDTEVRAEQKEVA